MGDRIFIDSNFFIALLSGGDSLNKRANELLGDLNARGFLPVTSNFVVSEVITVLSQRVDKQIAINFAQFVYHSSNLDIITVDHPTELKALDYLKNIVGKNISFCDCATIATMDLLKIKHLASFDNHFRIEGSNYKLWQ